MECHSRDTSCRCREKLLDRYRLHVVTFLWHYGISNAIAEMGDIRELCQENLFGYDFALGVADFQQGGALRHFDGYIMATAVAHEFAGDAVKGAFLDDAYRHAFFVF